MREKSLATEGLMPRASVITGKATAPPPSLVIPAHGQTCKQCLTTGPKMIKGLFRNYGISYEQPQESIYCSMTMSPAMVAPNTMVMESRYLSGK